MANLHEERLKDAIEKWGASLIRRHIVSRAKFDPLYMRDVCGECFFRSMDLPECKLFGVLDVPKRRGICVETFGKGGQR